MRKLSAEQLEIMDTWMRANARPYDLAKWEYVRGRGTKEAIVREMLRYQNPDGGMGNGFEADVLLPLSAAIPTAEAIFQAYEYGLDASAPWFARILAYFENTVQDIPKYWEDTPKEAMEYPHAPWWQWAPCTVFNPNPCGVVASAFIRHGSPSQKELGMRIADDCLRLLLSEDFCGDHDTLNMLALVEALTAVESPLIGEAVLRAVRRRIVENTSFEREKWRSYNFCPLDFVYSPDSPWLSAVERGVEDVFDFWLDTVGGDGVWMPNFSWGEDSDVSRQVTQNWKGYITVRRVKILQAFGRA
ncbi:MAG: hypothetical protein E7662_02680 [Ruminococcaceae bacterium]|nr:hypothetical protein [Oscillospiraceae bacterium]